MERKKFPIQSRINIPSNTKIYNINITSPMQYQNSSDKEVLLMTDYIATAESITCIKLTSSF